jgi:hypothetical protein
MHVCQHICVTGKSGIGGLHDWRLLNSCSKIRFGATRIDNNLNLQRSVPFNNTWRDGQCADNKMDPYLQSLCIVDEFPVIAIISFFRISLLAELDSSHPLADSLRSVCKTHSIYFPNLNIE